MPSMFICSLLVVRRSVRTMTAASPPVELAPAATSATVVMHTGHIVDLLGSRTGEAPNRGQLFGGGVLRRVWPTLGDATLEESSLGGVAGERQCLAVMLAGGGELPITQLELGESRRIERIGRQPIAIANREYFL